MYTKFEKKISKFQKKISNIESKYLLSPDCDLEVIKDFYKKFNNYKLNCYLLFNDSDFFYQIKDIQITSSDNKNIDSLNEIIWINEHYNLMQDTRSIEKDIKLMLKDCLKYGWLSSTQFNIIKKINPNIVKIFESDLVLGEFYEQNPNQITKQELDLYFDIIKTVILLLYKYKNNKQSKNIKYYELTYNQEYINSIKEFKNYLVKKNYL
jgi:hypothetical protein